MTTPSSVPANAGSRRHVFTWLAFLLTFFPLVALLTYDWRAIPSLCNPPLPSTNWIGALGDDFAFYGYTLFGLAVWTIPFVCFLLALNLVRRHRSRNVGTALWLVSFVIALSCELQVIGGHVTPIMAIIRRINTANAGGAFGYLIMTRALSPLIGDFGSSVLMAVLTVVTLIAAIGMRTIAGALSSFLNWALTRNPPADGFVADPNDPEALAEQERYQAALRAREEAKRQREEEKRLAREEKLREKEERRRRKEEEKLARYEEKLRRREQAGASEEDILPPVSRPTPKPPEPTAADVGDDKPPVDDKGPYILPSIALLNPLKQSNADHGNITELSAKLIDTLKLFGVDATLSYTVQGPVVTKYALLPAPGTRPEKFTSLQSTLMMALKAKSLRIEAPIPGEDKVGIEVPNLRPAGISFREIFESPTWRDSKAELPLLFGKKANGEELVADLASMPHMLVAGATGQGKSVCLNSLICGLLMTRTPEQLKLIMVDPKSVEFTPYAAIPHLLVPVITDNRKVVFSLHWAVAEMEKRLKLFARARVKNIYDFNHRKSFTQTDMFGADTEIGTDMPKTVPYIVIIIDEAADLIGQCGKEVNPDIQRITQKARAAGIHLILATQRPDAKIITGTIKANIPGRVAFKTSQAIDSRTILDESGAENLIGRGDMLFRGKDGLLIRAQGAWISDDEIDRVTKFIEEHSNVQFDEKFSKNLGRVKEAGVEDPFAALDAEENAENETSEAKEAAREQVKAEENASDFKKAVECIINTNRASTSHFQRKLGWGYNHSAKIMDMLEDAGIIGPQSGAGPRQIIMDQDQLLAVFNGSGSTGGSREDAPSELGEDKFQDNDQIIQEEQS